MLKTTAKMAALVLVLAVLCPAAFSQSTSTLLKITGTGQANTSGSVTITVNGVTETVPFGPYSTASSVAAGFGAYFSAPPQTTAPPLCASGICAKADGTAIVFQFEGSVATPTETWSATPNSPFGVDTSQWPGGSGLLPMTLVCTPNPVVVGGTTSCMAGLPAGTTGSVSFLVDGNNWQTGVALDSSGNAMASGGLSGASQGTHMVEATYTSATGVVSTAFENVEVEAGSGSSSMVYSYSISTQSAQPGYAANGNIVAYTDSVNGTWTLGYDSLNRLTSSAQVPVGSSSASTYGCWSYDSFGNRTEQATSNLSLSAGCALPFGATSFYATTMGYTDGTNRIISRSTITQSGPQSAAAPGYDNVGNVTTDQSFQYKYDGQGHLCAAQTAQGMVGYIYDAEGHRVAKGTITAMSCDPTANGFVVMTLYELGPNGQPMTEVDNGSWSHTDVYAGGVQVATYDGNGIHFQLHDWLGTRRVQTNYVGVVEDTCSSNPYGDGQTCSNAVMDTSDTHFTGKPRDAESGLDYFGARYYASSMGRWMSPDWSPTPTAVPYATLANPQTLNLYRYVANNPLVGRDLDGHRYIANVPNSLMISIYDNLLRVETNPAQIMAEQIEDEQKQQKAPPPQRDSDVLTWKQHFGNLFHGHGWNYLPSGSVSVDVVDTLIEEHPDVHDVVGTGADAVAIAGILKDSRSIGALGAVISIANDHGWKNVTLTGMSYIPKLGDGVAVVGTLYDFGAISIRTYSYAITSTFGAPVEKPIVDESDPSSYGVPVGPY